MAKCTFALFYLVTLALILSGSYANRVDFKVLFLHATYLLLLPNAHF